MKVKAGGRGLQAGRVAVATWAGPCHRPQALDPLLLEGRRWHQPGQGRTPEPSLPPQLFDQRQLPEGGGQGTHGPQGVPLRLVGGRGELQL